MGAIFKVIICRGETFGTINGVVAKNSEIQCMVIKHLKAGTARKVLDTDTTLMYELGKKYQP